MLLGKELITEAIVDNLLSWRHSGFSAHGAVRVEDRQGAVDHVPEPSQQMVRYWGYYANAARGKRRKAAQGGNAIQTPPSQDDDEFSRRARLTWAKLIRRVYEVDPLLCPFCGAEMKILAFIVDFPSAKALRKSLKLPAQEPEPLAHAPPETFELIAESA